MSRFAEQSSAYDPWATELALRHAHRQWLAALIAGSLRMASARVAAAVRRRFDTRHALHQLRSLSDHQLRDIGIRRSDIPHVVRFGRG